MQNVCAHDVLPLLYPRPRLTCEDYGHEIHRHIHSRLLVVPCYRACNGKTSGRDPRLSSLCQVLYIVQFTFIRVTVGYRHGREWGPYQPGIRGQKTPRKLFEPVPDLCRS